MIAKITFNIPYDTHLENDSFVYNLLFGLSRYYYIYGDPVIGDEKGYVTAYVNVYDQFTLYDDDLYDCVKESVQSISENFPEIPNLEILSPLSDKESIWDDSMPLVLTTSLISIDCPLQTLYQGTIVPVYFLKLSTKLAELIYFWNKAYINFENIWLRSKALEIESYKQMACIDSELNIERLDICGQLQTELGVPVYYYLHRYWGSEEYDKDLLCPKCGGNWTVDKGTDSNHDFDYLCDNCKLVSYIASSYEDEYATIGLYNK